MCRVDGGADLDDPLGLQRGDEHGQQPPGLPEDDGDVVALGERLHVGHDVRARPGDRVEIRGDVVGDDQGAEA